MVESVVDGTNWITRPAISNPIQAMKAEYQTTTFTGLKKMRRSKEMANGRRLVSLAKKISNSSWQRYLQQMKSSKFERRYFDIWPWYG